MQRWCLPASFPRGPSVGNVLRLLQPHSVCIGLSADRLRGHHHEQQDSQENGGAALHRTAQHNSIRTVQRARMMKREWLDS